MLPRGQELPSAPGFSIFQMMISLVTRCALRPLALLLATLFVATLVWCGDAECSSGTGPDQCASLLCALFANHNAPADAQDPPCAHDCTCACHTPVLPAIESRPVSDVLAEPATFEYLALIPTSPLRMVYHPPRG
jgi:hypothetical protein